MGLALAVSVLGTGHIDGDILNHIFLSTHGFHATEFDQDISRGQVVFFGGSLGKEKKRRVDTGIA